MSLADANKVATEQISDQFSTREKAYISFFNVFKFKFISLSNVRSCTVSVAHVLGVNAPCMFHSLANQALWLAEE